MRKVIDFINGNKVTLTTAGITISVAMVTMVLPNKLACIGASQLGAALERNLGSANAHYEIKAGFVELRIKLTNQVRLIVRYSNTNDNIVGISLIDEGRRSIYNMVIPRLRVSEVSMSSDELIDEVFVDSYEALLSEFVDLVNEEEEEEVLIS